MRNIHCRFDWHYIGQIYDGDFAKFCGLLRIPIWTLMVTTYYIVVLLMISKSWNLETAFEKVFFQLFLPTVFLTMFRILSNSLSNRSRLDILKCLSFKDFYYLTWSKLELSKRNIFSIYWTNESSIDIGRKIIKGQFLPQIPNNLRFTMSVMCAPS